MPIRARIALTVLAVSSLLMFAGLSFFDHQLQLGMRQAVDETLDARAAPLVAALRDTPGAIDHSDLERRVVSSRSSFAQIIDADGEIVASSLEEDTEAVVPTGALDELDAPQFSDINIDAVTDLEETRILSVPVDRVDGTWAVLVGASLEVTEHAGVKVRNGLILGGTVAVLLTTIGAWLLAGAALAPVERMRREAAGITARDGDTEIAVPGRGNELSRLASTFNDLLRRMRAALARERRFVADASHELRTPLAVLRTELELAARPGRSLEELRTAVGDAHIEAARLGRLADDLLLLARSEEGASVVRALEHDLATVLDRALGAFEDRAARIDVALRGEFARPLSATGDPDRLRQAVDNLLDNALRYAPTGSQVTLAASRQDHTLTISTTDEGPGFPPEFLPHAFKAFQRADPARRRDRGGAGLGLAIVETIARAHDGRAAATNPPDGGARVVLTIPQPDD